MTNRQPLTQKVVQKSFDYNMETGIWRWKVKPAPNVNIGDIAGSTQKRGNLSVWFCGAPRLLKRLAILYVEGYWPDGDVICIDGDVTNLKYKNLKVVKPEKEQTIALEIKESMIEHWKKKTGRGKLEKELDSLLYCEFIGWINIFSNISMKNIDLIVRLSLFWSRETKNNKLAKLKTLEKMLKSTKQNWLLKFERMEFSMIDYHVIQEIKKSNINLEWGDGLQNAV